MPDRTLPAVWPMDEKARESCARPFRRLSRQARRDLGPAEQQPRQRPAGGALLLLPSRPSIAPHLPPYCPIAVVASASEKFAPHICGQAHVTLAAAARGRAFSAYRAFGVFKASHRLLAPHGIALRVRCDRALSAGVHFAPAAQFWRQNCPLKPHHNPDCIVDAFLKIHVEQSARTACAFRLVPPAVSHVLFPRFTLPLLPRSLGLFGPRSRGARVEAQTASFSLFTWVLEPQGHTEHVLCLGVSKASHALGAALKGRLRSRLRSHLRSHFPSHL
eukprot:3977671-Pleurochrysis_carterae.AAC.2